MTGTGDGVFRRVRLTLFAVRCATLSIACISPAIVWELAVMQMPEQTIVC